MEIQFLGATGTVTGSKYLVRSAAGQVMVDCGLFQGVKDWRVRNRQPLPFRPADLDAVVLTHAHLDHTGYLPVLVRDGFRGPVFCTAATRDLASIILLDSAHLQEEDAANTNRHGYSRHQPALPLYTHIDAEHAIDRLRAVDFGETIELGGGMQAVLQSAGHILGAATVRIAGDRTSVLFSGDLGRDGDPLILPPSQPPTADYVVVESTYGNRRHGDADPVAALANAVCRTAARGGTVLIPAFAVARAQAILFELYRLAQSGRIPSIPIFLDSPMASRATDVFLGHADELRADGGAFRRALAKVQVVESVPDSKRIDRLSYPRIIVSASGMATAGRVLHHLKALAPDPRNTILLAGFQGARYARRRHGLRCRRGEDPRCLRPHPGRSGAPGRLFVARGLRRDPGLAGGTRYAAARGVRHARRARRGGRAATAHRGALRLGVQGASLRGAGGARRIHPAGGGR